MCKNEDRTERGVFDSTVIENVMLCSEHFRLRLNVPHFPRCSPGNFLQIACGPGEVDCTHSVMEWTDGGIPQFDQPELVSPEPFLRRPISIAGARYGDKGAEVELIYRVVGLGTSRMSSLVAGDHVTVLGPLGNSFPAPEDGRNAVLVGGGVGIPPLVYLGQELASSGVDVTAFFGGSVK